MSFFKCNFPNFSYKYSHCLATTSGRQVLMSVGKDSVKDINLAIIIKKNIHLKKRTREKNKISYSNHKIII